MRIESFRFSSSVSFAKMLPRGLRPRTELYSLRTWLCVAMLTVFACTTALAQVKNYTKIVVFGDSLSDTGNVGQLVLQKYPTCGPLTCLDYAAGRITDGAYTVPAAQNYLGVWIEQLAAELPGKPEILDSLDGGTNYAYAYATTGNGTSELCYVDCSLYSVEVENMGQQITDYLSTHPKIHNPKISSRTLFVVWGGADNILQATSVNDVVNGAVEEGYDIQKLIQAGATQILVPNVPPLGLTPLFKDSPADAAIETAAAALYNSYLATEISILKYLYARKHVTFYQVDVFDLMNNVVADPTNYGLTDVTDSSQGLLLDPNTGLPVNPDTYLFWDDLHPTTKGHNILANAALSVLSQ